MPRKTADRLASSARPPLEEHTALLRDAQTGQWLALTEPQRIISTCNTDEVVTCLHEVEAAVAGQGVIAAGFLTYEAATAFDAALTTHRASSGFPLLWFGLFRQSQVTELPPPIGLRPALAWQSTIDPEAYRQRLQRIHGFIAAGDTYQVNFSYRLRTSLSGDAWPLFTHLASCHDPEFGAYLHLGRWEILSLSPELFFRRDGDQIVSIPMKGTIGRGLNVEDDRAQGLRLHNSHKDRAENVMIVDMVRHDLGRIALPGSVRVEELFAVRRYSTLWQMTSTVTAQVRAPLADVFSALFPAASITGAPKARTMAIIKELETSPRRIYTGAIGFLLPGGRAQFNVAIRTLLHDRHSQTMEYGVGGGIVADSSISDEWEETRIKSLICRAPQPAFHLFETLEWTAEGGYTLLPHHLGRLSASAAHFSYRCNIEDIRTQLATTEANYRGRRHKVKILLDRQGTVRIEETPLPDSKVYPPVRLALAPRPLDDRNVFLYHKTTCRTHYEQALASAPPWADDMIFYNRRGEITETTIANIVVTLGGRRYTPPVLCGLLPGTLRQHLLKTGEIEERILTVDCLDQTESITLINSVRGCYAGVLLSDDAPRCGPRSP